MKKYISIVLLLSFVYLPRTQTAGKQQYRNNSVDCEAGYIDDHEECYQADRLNLLRHPLYGKIEVSWRMPVQPLQHELEEDTAKASGEEKVTEARPKFKWWGCCIAGGIAVGGLVLIFIVSMGRWLAAH